MSHSRCNAAVVLVSLSGIAIWSIAAPLAPVEKGTWAKPVGNLSGRILVAKERIESSENFELILELRNTNGRPLALQTENPFAFTVRVLNGAGKPVMATSTRWDVLYSPQWAIVPRNCCLSFPVSIKSADGAKGSHLDITTLIWKLPDAKYRIEAEYSSGAFGEFKEKPENVTLWKGTLALPPVDVEIKTKE